MHKLEEKETGYCPATGGDHHVHFTKGQLVAIPFKLLTTKIALRCTRNSSGPLKGAQFWSKSCNYKACNYKAVITIKPISVSIGCLKEPHFI